MREKERQRREGGSTIQRGVETVAMLLGESGEQRTAREKGGVRAQFTPLTAAETIVHMAERQQRKPLTARPGRRPLPSVPLSVIGQHRWLCCHHSAITAPSLSHLAHQPSYISKSTLQIRPGYPRPQMRGPSLLLHRLREETTTSWKAR